MCTIRERASRRAACVPFAIFITRRASTIRAMEGRDHRKALAQGLGALLVLASASGTLLHSAHKPLDAATARIIADTGRSQATEAKEFGHLRRAGWLPDGVAAVHLHQLRKQVSRNEDKRRAHAR
jgi:hypothetical protein